MEEKLIEAKKLLENHGRAGEWDQNPYTHGMYNGMELIISVLEGRKPKFRSPPMIAEETGVNKNGQH